MKQERLYSFDQPDNLGGININASNYDASSVGGQTAKTHISKWEQQIEVSETSSTTHIPKEI